MTPGVGAALLAWVVLWVLVLAAGLKFVEQGGQFLAQLFQVPVLGQVLM